MIADDAHVIPRWALLVACFLLRDNDRFLLDGWDGNDKSRCHPGLCRAPRPALHFS